MSRGDSLHSLKLQRWRHADQRQQPPDDECDAGANVKREEEMKAQRIVFTIGAVRFESIHAGG